MKGYVDKIAKIDLNTRLLTIEELNVDELKKFIGGSGLGSKYLFELTDGNTDPLGKENVLIFMTGPFTGTKAFSSDRFQVVTKSPLTGIYGESNCGGTWGSRLKQSGFDGLIITGKSDKPVYIYINNEKIEFLDADDLWGLDTFETDSKIRQKISKRARVACIGPAGEKMVRYAVISTIGEHARVAGRIGAGAVMGSKNLKAIVVDGDQDFELHDPDGFKNFYKNHQKEMVSGEVSEFLRDYGTAGGMEECEVVGNIPVKNWTEIRFKDADKISGQEMDNKILAGNYACGKCLIGCGRVVEIKDGKYKTNGKIGGPEYETTCLLGSNILVNDIKAIAKMNELCNRYGFDTITCGSVLGMMMECFENKVININDLDGINLKWGDSESSIALIHKIGKREGIGKLLGEGTRKIAEKLGSGSKEFAAHVKGLEIPGHDPRCKVGSALGYATSNRGACHMAAYTSDHEDGGSIPDLGFAEPFDRFKVEGKAEMVARFQEFMGMFDSVPACKFVAFSGITLDQSTEMLNLITGFGFTKEDYLKAGERIFNLKRLYNVKCGISRKDDTLPSRFFTLIKEEGEFGHKAAPLEKLLDEYYEIRGWNNDGIPTIEKIKELGLEEYS